MVGVNITNTIGTYYVGSCSIGTDKFGKQIRFFNRQTYQYSEFNNAFGETIGNNSFCALSSLITQTKDIMIILGLLAIKCFVVKNP